MLFWILAISLASIAIAFVLVPLLRTRGFDHSEIDSQRAENIRVFAEREQELATELRSGFITDQEHSALLRELQQSLLDNVDLERRNSISSTKLSSMTKLLALGIAIAIPLIAVSLYQRWGYIEDVELMELFQRTLAVQGNAEAASELVVDIGNVVREDTEKPWAWYFLGENFATLGMFNEAQIAYLQAAERLQGQPDEALALGRAALALYIKSEFEFSTELEEIIAKAQAINPNEIAVIQLLAADAQNRGDYATAISNWRLLIQSDPNSAEADALRAEIANAQRLLREENGEEIAGPVIDVHLAIAEGLQLDPDWRVFVAVRNAEREGMPPLAALDLRVGDLPIMISLDNDSAVGPFNLSSAEVVSVSALVSRSGVASPATGDYRVVSDKFAHNGQHAEINLIISDLVD